MRIIKLPIKKIKSRLWVMANKKNLLSGVKLHLGAGENRITGYTNLDLEGSSEILVNLKKRRIPLNNESCSVVVSMSLIEYFSVSEAIHLLRDVHRVMETGGVIRLGTPDLEILTKKYQDKDEDFFFKSRPKLSGATYCEKYCNWFGGQFSGTGGTKIIYDIETLLYVFNEAGFINCQKKEYGVSLIANINKIDNRKDHFLYVEAIK